MKKKPYVLVFGLITVFCNIGNPNEAAESQHLVSWSRKPVVVSNFIANTWKNTILSTNREWQILNKFKYKRDLNQDAHAKVAHKNSNGDGGLFNLGNYSYVLKIWLQFWE